MPDGTNPAAERLADEDSQAYQVRAFLRSVQPLNGCDTPDSQVGRDLIQDYVIELAVSGCNADRPLTVLETAQVLDYLSHIEPREGKEDYAAGGAATCGHLRVLSWLAQCLRNSAAV